MSDAQIQARWWQRLIQRFTSTRLGSWFFSKWLHHADRFLLRITGGRVALPQVLAGIPVIWLTAVGAKSGKERTVPLLGIPEGDGWFVVASNWGGESHPAWYHNVSANPEVTVTHDGESGEYVAREATGDEREAYWERATDIYVGFEAYEDRSGDREIPIVVLEPAEE